MTRETARGDKTRAERVDWLAALDDFRNCVQMGLRPSKNDETRQRTILDPVSSARLRKQALFRGPRLVQREARLPPTQWSRAHDQDFIVPGNWFLCALHDRRRERENVRLAAPLVSCGLLEVHTECDASAIAVCL